MKFIRGAFLVITVLLAAAVWWRGGPPAWFLLGMILGSAGTFMYCAADLARARMLYKRKHDEVKPSPCERGADGYCARCHSEIYP